MNPRKFQNLFIFVLLAEFLFTANSFSQDVPNKYGLTVISDTALYHQSIRLDSTKELVDLQTLIPDLVPDVRYATTGNFLKEVIYDQPYTFVRKPVAEALVKIQQELRRRNIGLKIFDGYRPYRVTVYFYEKTHDSIYCAVPWRGSRHNRGCAVDVSLVSLKTGKELIMPTQYDDFSERANPGYPDLPDIMLANRTVLINVMEKYGFSVLPSEWWHFDFKGWERYEIMDISFGDLKNN